MNPKDINREVQGLLVYALTKLDENNIDEAKLIISDSILKLYDKSILSESNKGMVGQPKGRPAKK